MATVLRSRLLYRQSWLWWALKWSKYILC